MNDHTLVPLYMQFTERKREIIELACMGLSNRAIATVLFIEPCTVAAHLTEIYETMETWDAMIPLRPNRMILIRVFAPFFDRNPLMRNRDLCNDLSLVKNF